MPLLHVEFKLDTFHMCDVINEKLTKFFSIKFLQVYPIIHSEKTDFTVRLLKASYQLEEYLLC